MLKQHIYFSTIDPIKTNINYGRKHYFDFVHIHKKIHPRKNSFMSFNCYLNYARLK